MTVYAQVRLAVLAGKLPRLDGTVACVDCGAPATAYDHRDYAKPLEVEPVCRRCNARRGPAAGQRPLVAGSAKSFRLDERMKEDLEACAEATGSSDTEVLRQALRLFRRKVERERGET